MPTTENRDEVTMPVPASRAYQFALSALNNVGGVDSASENAGMIRGIIGSGALGMNPAELIIQVTGRADSESHIALLARAQEGLISQNTGGKAIGKFLQSLHQVYNARTFAALPPQPLAPATAAAALPPQPIISPGGPGPVPGFGQTAKWMLIGFGLLFAVTFLSWKAVLIIGIVAGVIAALKK